MQTIKHSADYISPSSIFDDLERLYTELSDTKKKRVGLFSQPYDRCFEPLVKAFMQYTDSDFSHIEYTDKKYDLIPLDSYDPKNIIVCYSGGKDSFAALRHYQKLGYNVYAYHIKGLNKTYYDEWEVAEKTAEALGIKLYIDSVTYSGAHCWTEHPMKNMLMATMALAWGIREHVGVKVACGTFKTAHLEDVAFDVCGGDCVEMWEMFDDIVSKVIPSFHMYIANANYQTAFNLLKKEPKSLEYTISCVTPNRFRALFRKRTMFNYGVELLPYRCGCCWKCAVEYIWFCDHNVLGYDRDYYLHCVEVLSNTIWKETGYYPHSIEYVWDKYMFYSMRKSKAYKELKDAFIYARKIKVAH